MDLKTLKALTILFTIAFTTNAFAGAVSGGGGKAVVCRNPDGSIRSAEALDLWEARVIYNREIIRSERTVAELVEEGIERLKFSYLPGIGPWSEDGKNVIERLDLATKGLRGASPALEKAQVQRLSGVTLTNSADSFELARPSECQVEQVVQAVDRPSRFLINQEIYEALDNVNQAALILHEGLYSVLRRDHGESSSLRTRRAVGMVMAGQSFQDPYRFLGGERITCTSQDEKTRMHIVEFVPSWLDTPEPMIGFYVERVAGSAVMGIDELGPALGGISLTEYFSVVDPNRPYEAGDNPHFPLEGRGQIEPELQAWLEAKGVPGGKRKVLLRLSSRVEGTTPAPYESELTCALVPKTR